MQLEVTTGTLVGGFRVVSLIGGGAMGRVYLADDVAGQRPVALKLLLPELARDERFRRRFLRESLLASRIDHPHVVRTLASGEDRGLLYLAMDHVDGSDLRELLRREGRLAPGRALELVSQAAGALDAAHAVGLVHRDVKPANILVGSTDGREHVYVCDFGLARRVSSSSLTNERGLVGTVDYVAPEQIEGGAVGNRADVYSLGCVLFECLAGERPFDRETDLAVLFAHLNEPPPHVTHLQPELPEALDAVLTRALAKAPGDRYACCGELAAAVRAALAGKPIARRERPRQRTLARASLATVVAATAAVGTILAFGGAGGGGRPAVDLEPNALNLVDVGTSRLVSRIGLGSTNRFGTTPWDVAFSKTSAWVLSGGAQRLARIDLRTHRLAQIVSLPWVPGRELAIGGGSLWLTEDGGTGVVQIDERSGKVLRRFSIPGQGPGVAFGAGALWLTRDDDVVRVEPGSGRVPRRIATSEGLLSTLVFADGVVWAASGENGVVVKIDPVENRVVATARLHGWLADLAVGGGSVWASTIPDGTVFELSESDLGVRSTVHVAEDPERLSFDDKRLWIANSAANLVSVLDPGSGRLTALRTDSAPSIVRYRNGLLWAGGNPAIAPLPPVSGQELRVSTPQAFTDADPSTARLDPQNMQLFYATCANLLGYPDAPGPAGARLRPELAVVMPSLSADGRTYTFHVRRGIRFSPPSNELVTAATFRHTIERALSPRLEAPPALGLASDIVGVPAFRAGRSPHISGLTARGSTLSITLRRPAGDFLERISLFTFCPVPVSQPVVPGGLTGPIPSLGPYYPSAMTDGYTVLLRNPNYRGTRPRRAARIVFRFGIATPRAVRLADDGKLELLPTDFDSSSLLAPGGPLDRGFGPASAAARRGHQRYFREPVPSVHMLVFNTRRPLFRDARLRRAVSYALDRPALAAALDDDAADALLSPAVTGFPTGPLHPFGRPNLAVARRLAGTTSRKAVLYAPCGSAHVGVAEIVRSNLKRIGIAVSIVKTDACPSRYADDPRIGEADILLAGAGSWPQRDPGVVLDRALDSGAYGSALGPGPWDTPSFRARVARARAFRGRSRIAAYRRLHAELMRAAPFAVHGSVVRGEYVSPRVGCALVQGAYAILDLGALCVRRG